MSGAKDKPISFSAPMVRALLDGRKSQTRRLIKPPRGWGDRYPHYCPGVLDNGLWFWDGEHDRVGCSAPMPYAVGDRLWVRESCAIVDGPPYGSGQSDQTAIYRADGEQDGIRWRPSIHMPRWASRFTLTVTDVRVQRLQEISEEDARAEGVRQVAGFFQIDKPDGKTAGATSAVGAFALLWNSLHGAAWAANPWVVALTFCTAHRNIDAKEAA